MIKHYIKWPLSKGREIAESTRQQVEPEDELEIGKLVHEFEEDPDTMNPDFIDLPKVPIERKQGKILDEDVQIGRYVFFRLLIQVSHQRKHHFFKWLLMRNVVLQLDLYCRLVESPVKVLAEIKADGGSIEMVDGEIVAGDAGEVPAIRMLGNTPKS